MQAEAIAEAVKQTADFQLERGVLAANPGHVAAALFGRNGVHELTLDGAQAVFYKVLGIIVTVSRRSGCHDSFVERLHPRPNPFDRLSPGIGIPQPPPLKRP